MDTINHCVTHGYTHYTGETDDARVVGDTLECREETWGPVVVGQVVRSANAEPIPSPDFTLTTAALAYIDGFRGLVPCKITKVETPTRENLYPTAEVRITANRPGYKRGEKLTLRIPSISLVARDQVVLRRGQYRILGTTGFMSDEGDLL